MQGIYLYGISLLNQKKPLDENMDSGIGGGRVFGIPYKDILAVTSEVSLKEFGSEEIQRKAVEDIEWIKDKVLAHEKTTEAAMNNSDGLIIPMKFGAIFKDKKNLVGSLKKDYLRFKNLLQSLRGKEERSVKIYCKAQLLENEIKKKLPMIQNKLKEIKFLPAGRQYFLEEEINEMVKKEARQFVNSYISLFVERLQWSAEKFKENKLLGKELTQKNDPMVFNCACLVKKEKVERFQAEIQKLQTEYKKIGFFFESSGPWPPYNFVG